MAEFCNTYQPGDSMSPVILMTLLRRPRNSWPAGTGCAYTLYHTYRHCVLNFPAAIVFIEEFLINCPSDSMQHSSPHKIRSSVERYDWDILLAMREARERREAERASAAASKLKLKFHSELQDARILRGCDDAEVG
jgi:hypothetical protein